MAADSKDEEDLPVAELDDPVWHKELVLNSRDYLCIHEIPRPATPPPQPQPGTATPTPQPDQGLPDTPPHQANQVGVLPELELMELDIPDDIPELIGAP